MSEEIQRLNYSAHALDQFAVLIPTIRRDMPGMRAGYEAVSQLLRVSVKYLLPNCAELIDVRELRQAHIDSMRLPHAVVALEAPWILRDGEGGDKTATRSPKRIALCVELDADVAELLPGAAHFLAEEGGGVCVIPVFWTEAAGWQIAPGGAFVPHSNEVSAYVPEEADERTRLVNEPLREAGLSPKKMRQFQVAPFVVLPERYEYDVQQLGSLRAVHARTLAEARDEILALIQTGCVVNCANIDAPLLEAPAKLNRKREQAGRTPFFDYRVLALRPPRSGAGEGRGGQHASPKAHIRRGHIRRLEHKQVWVSDTLVNASSERGVVVKDYEVRPLRR
ncbi:hypothetical protein BVER_03852c [Candidatus Burkholderia verschuerenii]|uniref:Uncharacterized protein n=1 Tax=Candidatus Burkholderia verschuerenii TaxID=242163 RepID=A0A0L0MDN1_9BURK|nr:hypothetical protein [Candidatus Burkholderia verschuerenii]KND60406.1 hypothetical protein BVER_03852c [Candidatus Burkholderia verschuerenii]